MLFTTLAHLEHWQNMYQLNMHQNDETAATPDYTHQSNFKLDKMLMKLINVIIKISLFKHLLDNFQSHQNSYWQVLAE